MDNTIVVNNYVEGIEAIREQCSDEQAEAASRYFDSFLLAHGVKIDKKGVASGECEGLTVIEHGINKMVWDRLYTIGQTLSMAPNDKVIDDALVYIERLVNGKIKPNINVI